MDVLKLEYLIKYQEILPVEEIELEMDAALPALQEPERNLDVPTFPSPLDEDQKRKLDELFDPDQVTLLNLVEEYQFVLRYVRSCLRTNLPIH